MKMYLRLFSINICGHSGLKEKSYLLLGSTEKKNSFPVISIDFADVNKIKVKYKANKAQARNEAILQKFYLVPLNFNFSIKN